MGKVQFPACYAVRQVGDVWEIIAADADRDQHRRAWCRLVVVSELRRGRRRLNPRHAAPPAHIAAAPGRIVDIAPATRAVAIRDHAGDQAFTVSELVEHCVINLRAFTVLRLITRLSLGTAQLDLE